MNFFLEFRRDDKIRPNISQTLTKSFINVQNAECSVLYTSKYCLDF